MPIDSPNPPCPSCGKELEKEPTYPAMVKMKGMGGYPARRKMTQGSAPFTTRATKAWGDHDPSDKSIDYFSNKK